MVLAVSTATISDAAAMPEMNIIMSNCRTAQSILRRVEKADVSTRLNRGSDYDRLLKLMFTMNSRLAANRIAAPELSSITAQYEQTISQFRKNYDIYSGNLTYVSEISCATKPMEFYDSLEKTRASRLTLHDNVIELKRLSEDYRAALNETVGDII